MHIKASDRKCEPTAHGAIKEVLLKGGVVTRITQVAVGTMERVYSTEESAHSHPTMWELYYILEGAARYFVGDEVYDVLPGDLVCVPPRIRHFQESLEAPHRFLYWGISTEE